MRDNTCVVGIDVGGTTITSGLVAPDGKLIEHFTRPTESEKGPDRAMENILRSIEDIIAKAGDRKILGIGLGTPGAVDVQTGLVLYCAPNIPNWTGRQLKTPIEERFRLPVFVDNDAKMAVMGEATFGAGAGLQHVFVVTLGTGIGGGVVLNGRIHRGAYFCAGEIGHAVVQIGGRRCACGIEGHLEAYLSAKGLVGQLREAVDAGRKTTLTAKAGADLSRLKARMILEAAREGEPLSREIVDLSCHYMGMALAHFSMVFDPEMMILSGGIAQAWDVIFEPIQNAYERYLFYRQLRMAPIVPAKLGFEAGMVGAAAMAMVELELV